MRLFFLALLLFFMLPVVVAAQTTPCPNDTLVACILRNDTAAVRQCLKNGADPNAEWHGYDVRYWKKTATNAYEVYRRPMYFAIEVKSLYLVKMLVEFGASIQKAEIAVRDTLARDPVFDGWIETPLSFAQSEKLSDMVVYLSNRGALSPEAQCLLGDRFYNLLPYCRKSADSLAALKMLIREHYDEIEFAGRRKRASTEFNVLVYNVKPAIDYMIDKHKADFKKVVLCRNSGSWIGGGPICDDFPPLWGLSFEYVSISIFEYLELKHILNDSIIKTEVLNYKSKKNKRVYTYYALRNKKKQLLNEPKNVLRSVKIKHIERRMHRIKKRDMRKRPDLV